MNAKKLIGLGLLVSIVASTSLMAYGEESGKSLDVTGKLPEANNQHVVNMPYGTKRYNSVEVTDQLNGVQSVANALMEEMAKLRFLMENAAGWSLTEHGLGEYTKTMLTIDSHYASVLALAVEKDPLFEEKMAAYAKKHGLSGIGDIGNRLARVENVLQIGSFKLLGTVPVENNSGLMNVEANGVNYKCTTEGYLKATPVKENYVVCTAATPGHQNLHKYAVGVYFHGDKNVDLLEWPTDWENIDYGLGIFNITAHNPSTKMYYNALKYGGDHVQGKTYSVVATKTDEKVVTTNNVKKTQAAPQPQPVVVVNTTDNPVPVTEQK